MDKEDEIYFKELINEYKTNTKGLENKIKDIWRQTIEDMVYSKIDLHYYADGTRERTYQLRDMVTSKTIGNTLYVYADTSRMSYYSFGRRSHPVDAEDVLKWVDKGHTQEGHEGLNDNFRDYRARGFLREFYNRVRQEYPEFEVELIDTEDLI